METRPGFRNILWAVDAFDDPERIQKQVPELIRSIAKNTAVTVQPVYILSPGEINLSVDFSGTWIEDYRPAAEAALKEALKKVKIPGLLKPEVLSADFSSTLQSAKALANHAQE